jgi:hypothetical protein
MRYATSSPCRRRNLGSTHRLCPTRNAADCRRQRRLHGRRVARPPGAAMRLRPAAATPAAWAAAPRVDRGGSPVGKDASSSIPTPTIRCASEDHRRCSTASADEDRRRRCSRTSSMCRPRGRPRCRRGRRRRVPSSVSCRSDSALSSGRTAGLAEERSALERPTGGRRLRQLQTETPQRDVNYELHDVWNGDSHILKIDCHHTTKRATAHFTDVTLVCLVILIYRYVRQMA